MKKAPEPVYSCFILQSNISLRGYPSFYWDIIDVLQDNLPDKISAFKLPIFFKSIKFEPDKYTKRYGKQETRRTECKTFS